MNPRPIVKVRGVSASFFNVGKERSSHRIENAAALERIRMVINIVVTMERASLWQN